MAGLVPAIHVFDALGCRPGGYRNEKALFLEAFAAGEANVKLVIDGAAWMAGTSPAMTVEAPKRSLNQGHSTAIAIKAIFVVPKSALQPGMRTGKSLIPWTKAENTRFGSPTTSILGRLSRISSHRIFNCISARLLPTQR